MWKKKGDIFKISPKKFGDTEIKSYLCIRIIGKRINKRHKIDLGFRCSAGTGILYFFMPFVTLLLITYKQQEKLWLTCHKKATTNS